MKPDFPIEWLKEFLNSGLVRAAALGGPTRGDGKRTRSGGHGALMVYLAILTYPEGNPSMSELERVTGIGSRNTLRDYLANLEALGAIKVGRYLDGNRYEVLPLPDLGLPHASPSIRRGQSEGRGDHQARKTYRGPDGHVLRSEVELAVDILLTFHGLAHAVEVPYRAIFEGFDGKHNIDFLLTPTLGIEVWGSSGPDYQVRRRLKEDVAKANKFVLHGVESLEDAYLLVPRLKSQQGITFGDAKLDDLHRLLRMFGQSPAHRDTLPGLVALKKRIEDVEAEAAKKRVVDPRERDADWFVDPRLINRRTEELGFRLESPELREVEERVRIAARMAGLVAGELARKPLLLGDNAEQSWAGSILVTARHARGHLDEADRALAVAVYKLERRAESPAQAEERRQQQVHAEAQEQRVQKALRLLKRVEAAMQGEGNPFAEGDARRAKEAKRAALKAMILDAMPELGLVGDEGNLGGVLNAIDDEIDPEKLADIL